MFKNKKKAKKKLKTFSTNITRINIKGGKSVIPEYILDEHLVPEIFFFDNYHQENV